MGFILFLKRPILEPKSVLGYDSVEFFISASGHFFTYSHITQSASARPYTIAARQGYALYHLGSDKFPGVR